MEGASTACVYFSCLHRKKLGRTHDLLGFLEHGYVFYSTVQFLDCLGNMQGHLGANTNIFILLNKIMRPISFILKIESSHFSFVLLIVYNMISNVKSKLPSLQKNKTDYYCIAVIRRVHF